MIPGIPLPPPSKFLRIEEDLISINHIMYMRLEEWTPDSEDDTNDFPYRLTILLEGNKEKQYDLSDKEYAEELVSKCDGTYQPKQTKHSDESK